MTGGRVVSGGVRRAAVFPAAGPSSSGASSALSSAPRRPGASAAGCGVRRVFFFDDFRDRLPVLRPASASSGSGTRGADQDRRPAGALRERVGDRADDDADGEQRHHRDGGRLRRRHVTVEQRLLARRRSPAVPAASRRSPRRPAASVDESRHLRARRQSDRRLGGARLCGGRPVWSFISRTPAQKSHRAARAQL